MSATPGSGFALEGLLVGLEFQDPLQSKEQRRMRKTVEVEFQGYQQRKEWMNNVSKQMQLKWFRILWLKNRREQGSPFVVFCTGSPDFIDGQPGWQQAKSAAHD